MISEKMNESLNKQINEELYSSYLYLSMSAYFEATNFHGMAVWMKHQADEEYQHAMKILGYVNDVGGRVKLGAIKEPKFEWTNPKEVFAESKEHEIFITKCIHGLAKQAETEDDYATRNFLSWFIDEQVEEIASVTEIVDRFEFIEDNKSALFLLDRELARRGQTH
ncbi:MAG: ferritin [Melioribacteraceae bacterium]|nr:ferritin [Melioribacteraceae bacterium]MCF8265908.1 ferritin [Melioribacteraceae bacterium]MCF8412944.1 ferritin [Melioribacteraceae bacterium]